MASKHSVAARFGLLTTVGVLGAAAAIVAVLGFNPSFAIADNSGETSSSFGIGSSTSSTSSRVGVLYEQAAAPAEKDADVLLVTSETSALERGTDYDVMIGVYQIERQREEARRAAEEAARIAEQEHIAKAEAAQDRWRGIIASDGSHSLADLPAVDWSVGKEAFIETWTERINAYLGRSPLGGYGETFAEAAWENGVDPRWSPAISNTESTKGMNCFLFHNAWGWGQSSWSSWSQAINAHVYGLSTRYGYSISLSFAKKYCPPTYESWYANTVSEMKRI